MLRLTHRTNADFWRDYHSLPADVQMRADKQFALLQTNPDTGLSNSNELASGLAASYGRRE